MQLASALTLSSDPEDVAELIAVVLLCIAIGALVWSGISARRKSKGIGKRLAKGNLRLVAGGALIVLLGLAIFGPMPVGDEEQDPSAAPSPSVTATTATTEAAQVFDNCDDADAEFKRLYDQLLQRGSEGDVPGMTASAESQLQTTILNEGCFSERSATAVSDVVTRLRADPLPPTFEEKVPEPCRPAIKDAVRLLNTAILRKSAGDDDAATRLNRGFARMGEANPGCLPARAIADFEVQLSNAPLGSAAAQ